MVASLLCALVMAPAGDRLLMVSTLNCQDWAQLANDYIAMGEEKAVAGLIERSKRPPMDKGSINNNVRAGLMIRLLYEPKEKEPLRQPGFGGLALPYRAMPLKDWPLYPFVKHDGVVFLMSEGYMLGGLPESTEMYVSYCKKNGKFRTQPYKVPTFAEAKKALEGFYASTLWKDLPWTYKSPHESYAISRSWIADYLAKQTAPSDF